MLRHRILAGLMVAALSACSLPPPYQTYSPGAAPAPSPKGSALTTYGATTTTPENQMDTVDEQISETPPPATPAPQAPAGSTRIAICYSRMWNSAEAVRNAANLACGSSGAARIVSQDTDLSACPILTPTHAIYACAP